MATEAFSASVATSIPEAVYRKDTEVISNIDVSQGTLSDQILYGRACHVLYLKAAPDVDASSVCIP